ncbi:MAG: hypothetical protein IPI20_18660 [Rhodoferax sp.]|nr:hypothetical protein [Rhodoferax sp.]
METKALLQTAAGDYAAELLGPGSDQQASSLYAEDIAGQPPDQFAGTDIPIFVLETACCSGKRRNR